MKSDVSTMNAADLILMLLVSAQSISLHKVPVVWEYDCDGIRFGGDVRSAKLVRRGDGYVLLVSNESELE